MYLCLSSILMIHVQYAPKLINTYLLYEKDKKNQFTFIGEMYNLPGKSYFF